MQIPVIKIKKYRIRLIVTVLCLLVWALLQIVRVRTVHSLSDLQGASRFAPEGGYAQIACYFSENAGASYERYAEFSYLVEQKLTENAIEPEEGARLVMDCFTVEGTVQILREGRRAQAYAIGTGGEFFYLHPVELVSGMYYSADAMTADQVLIDEGLAWQIFGGTDINGQMIYIGGKPHIVRGVVKSGQGRMRKAAGADELLVYMSAESLIECGELRADNESMTCYEAVMPDPVKNFAKTQMQEALKFDESEMEVVNDTTRFTNTALFDVIKAFGTRSMTNRAIHYPYWENIARGTEDILVIVMIVQIICIAIPVMILIVTIVRAYRNKTWRAAEVFSGIGEKFYGLQVHRRKDHGRNLT